MIFLNKNSTNNVIVTLTELSTLESPYYLFQFKPHASEDQVLFLAADQSSATTRYNKFSIIETGSTYTNLTAGTISMNEGWFSYNVYEQESNSNLDLSLTGNKVESGIGFVSGSTS